MPKDYFQGEHVEWTDLTKDERSRLRPIIGGILAAMLIGGSLIYAVKAWAEEIPLHVHEQDGLTIRLMPGPCVDANSVAFLGEPYVTRARALESVWRMQSGESRSFNGCWIELSAKEMGDDEKTEKKEGEDSFFLIFSDSERYLIPKAEFLKKRGQGGA